MEGNDHSDEPRTPSRGETLSKEDVSFDPSRMIGIIKRKALIKDLAAAYHAEFLSCCQELLQLQKKWEEEQYSEVRAPEEARKPTARPSKRSKKRM